jgi:hypothetical protein
MALNDLIFTALDSAYNATFNAASIGSGIATYVATPNTASSLESGVYATFATTGVYAASAYIRWIKAHRRLNLSSLEELPVLKDLSEPVFDHIELIDED